jgi:hypothetical protein
MSIVAQRAKDGKPKPVEITQSNVTVKVKGFEPVANGKVTNGPAHANFIESKHKNWKIRVWKIAKDGVYGCNYFKGEDVRYLEVPFGDVRDENGVFKYASSIIDDIDDIDGE